MMYFTPTLMIFRDRGILDVPKQGDNNIIDLSKEVGITNTTAGASNERVAASLERITECLDQNDPVRVPV